MGTAWMHEDMCSRLLVGNSHDQSDEPQGCIQHFSALSSFPVMTGLRCLLNARHPQSAQFRTRIWKDLSGNGVDLGGRRIIKNTSQSLQPQLQQLDVGVPHIS